MSLFKTKNKQTIATKKNKQQIKNQTKKGLCPSSNSGRVMQNSYNPISMGLEPAAEIYNPP